MNSIRWLFLDFPKVKSHLKFDLQRSLPFFPKFKYIHSDECDAYLKIYCHSIHFIRIWNLSRESVQILTRSNRECEPGTEFVSFSMNNWTMVLCQYIFGAVSSNPIQCYVIRSNELKLIFISQNNDRIKRSLLQPNNISVEMIAAHNCSDRLLLRLKLVTWKRWIS